MNTMLVWVLVISSWNASKNMADQLGPYADKESCELVRDSRPLASFETQCLQVKVPTAKQSERQGKGLYD